MKGCKDNPIPSGHGPILGWWQLQEPNDRPAQAVAFTSVPRCYGTSSVVFTSFAHWTCNQCRGQVNHANVVKTRISHPPVITCHHYFSRWYGYHSQSWVVYGIVLSTLDPSVSQEPVRAGTWCALSWCVPFPSTWPWLDSGLMAVGSQDSDVSWGKTFYYIILHYILNIIYYILYILFAGLELMLFFPNFIIQ